MTTHVNLEEDDLLPLSALNALLYCERRAALRHLDGLYIHNEHTRRGELQHKRVDHSGFEQRGKIRTERGLWIVSRRLRLYGRADLVEFHSNPDGGPEIPLPVEYKQGRQRRWDNDEVQLCAQALCLEEMLGRPVPKGAIYHVKSRKRRDLAFGPDLRVTTEATVDRLRTLLASDTVPPAVLKPQCRGCSLRAACLPEIFSQPNQLAKRARRLFQPSFSDPQA